MNAFPLNPSIGNYYSILSLASLPTFVRALTPTPVSPSSSSSPRIFRLPNATFEGASFTSDAPVPVPTTRPRTPAIELHNFDFNDTGRVDGGGRRAGKREIALGRIFSWSVSR